MIAFRSEISNARIIALALERLPYTWLIGKKVYDPEKIRVFLESIWSRIDVLNGAACVSEQEIGRLLATAQQVSGRLKILRNNPAAENDSEGTAEKLFIDLRELSSCFLSLYFGLKALRSSGVEGFRSAAHNDAHAEVV
jgi:hypothetical protein